MEVSGHEGQGWGGTRGRGRGSWVGGQRRGAGRGFILLTSIFGAPSMCQGPPGQAQRHSGAENTREKFVFRAEGGKGPDVPSAMHGNRKT